MSNQFTAQTLDGATRTLGQHMPQGRAWAWAKPGSVMGSLFASGAVPFRISQEHVELLSVELDVTQTTELIGEWEESVGIPDGCFLTDGTLTQRRNQVIAKLRKTPVVTIADLQAYVDFLFPGYTVTMYTGSEYYTFEYDFEVPFFGDAAEHWVVVAEIIASEGIDQAQLTCMLQAAIPANSVVTVESLPG